MCLMCDGFSFDDVVALHGAHIAEYGFTVVGVTASPPDDEGVEWAYTIGLLDVADHPELVVAGPEAVSGARLLLALGQEVLAGERFPCGGVLSDPPSALRFGTVDAVQHTLGVFGDWYAAKHAGHVRAARLEVLQVFAPDPWFCAGHGGHQPDLADPRTRLDARRSVNRAMRRAPARGTRRRTHPR